MRTHLNIEQRAGSFWITPSENDLVCLAIDDIEESHSRIFATVRVYLKRGGRESEFLRDRLELTSGRDKLQFSRRLTNSLHDTGDWGYFVELAFNNVIDRVVNGSPVIDLANLRLLKSNKYLLEPILAEHEPTIIYGDGGSAKSTTAIFLGLLVCSGAERLGLQPTKQAKILFLDWETDAHIIAERVQKLSTGLDISLPSGFLYRKMTRGLSSDSNAIKNLIEQEKVALVIVDSMGPACEGEPESAEVVLRFFNALRLFDCSKLITAHISKAVATNNSVPSYPFGSIFARNLARIMWGVTREKLATNEDAVSIVLHNTKANDDRLRDPIGISYSFSEVSIGVARFDPSANVLFERLPLREKIRAILEEGPATTKELSRQVGSSESSVRRIIRLMRDVERVEEPDGKLGLAWRIKSTL